MSQYIQTGAFGLQNVLSKAKASLQVAAAKLPGAAAAPSAQADKPWYMRPTTWLLGGGLLLAAVLVLRKQSEPRSNPRTAKRGWGVRRKSYAKKLRAPRGWGALRRKSTLKRKECSTGCGASTQSRSGKCLNCQYEAHLSR